MMHKVILFLFLLAITPCLRAQSAAAVTFEAEAGAAGADFNTTTEGDITYVVISTNGTASAPESAARVITYEVTFAATGTYDLYARLRVGPGGADDDSFHYGAAFGEQDVTDAAAWITSNQLASVGFTDPQTFVNGNGSAGGQVWKWVNVSEYDGFETPTSFTVPEGALTQTIQIGAREDGLEFDRFAFGRADLFYTVAALDNGGEGVPEPVQPEDDRTPIAQGQAKFLGNVYSPSQTPDFASFWNQVTPENAGKWGSVEGQRDVMNWAALDAAYQLAQDNDFYFKFHVLTWGSQQPAWIRNLPPAEQRAEIEEWYRLVAERYPDIDAIEVTNEPVNQPPTSDNDGNYIDALGGTGATGYDWIITAFTLARQYFPNADLMINEYNVVSSSNVRSAYLDIINLLQDRNLIDIVGVQAHAFSTTVNSSVITGALDELAATGLPIHVTELDIDGATDFTQLAEYRRVFPLFWEHPSVTGITLWGWRPGLWRDEQGAFLIDRDNVTERPALIWLRAYVENNFVPISSIDIATVSGDTIIDTDDGTLQFVATFTPDSATIRGVRWGVNNPTIAVIDQQGLLRALENGTVRVAARSADGSNLRGEKFVVITNQNPTSTQQLARALGVALYPNPVAGDYLFLEKSSQLVRIRIHDLSGRMVLETACENQAQITVDLSKLLAGTYLVELFARDGGRQVNKIIIQ